MQPFVSTHRIEHGGRSVCVMLTDDGAAYTREEWDAADANDYSLTDGQWLFQGAAFTGSVHKLDGCKKCHGDPSLLCDCQQGYGDMLIEEDE